jgi:hypothetical protein
MRIALLAIICLAGRTAAADPARFALFVGANQGDPHEPVLHHAEDDAARLAQTFRTLGDVPPDQVVLMTGASASELREALIRLNARVREHREGVLLVFYSGHADAEALHVGGSRLPMAELKGLLVGSPAVSRVLIVDACRSGALIQLKGAYLAPPFVVPALAEPVPEGFAVLTSSAATEDSQESMALGSSFFTYYLNSGLIGAADQDRDGAVTLSELYGFASAETRSATARTLAGPQNPTFQFQLGGRRDLVLTRPGRRDVRLGSLRFAQAGRYVVQRWQPAGLSPPVAEVATSDADAQIALPAGSYRVTRRDDRSIAERDCAVTAGQTTTVEVAQMSRIDLGRVVRKGGTRTSATGVVLLAGWHSDELWLSQRSLTLGEGLSLAAAVRHDRRRFSLEARLGFDRGETPTANGIDLRNQALTPALALLFPFDWRTVTLTVGAQAGIALVYQSYDFTPAHFQSVGVPATPVLNPARWFTGFAAGPLAQIDFPLGQRAYLRFEGGLALRWFSGPPTSAPYWSSSENHAGAHARLAAGGGLTF